MAITILEELLKTGRYNITLLTEIMAYPGILQLVQKYPDLSYCARTNKSKPKNFFLKLLWKFPNIKYLFQKYLIVRRKYDIIIDYKNGQSLKFVKEIKDTPKVTWLHGSIKWFESSFTKQSFASCDSLICLTDNMKKCLLEWYSTMHSGAVTPHPTIYHIYNIIDIAEVNEIANEVNAGLFPHRYFVYVARLDEDKDCMTVIEAYDAFQQQHDIDVHLYIIGDGVEREMIRKEIMKRKLQDKVHLLGFIYQPYAYIKHALASILSSHSEGLPTVLLEAMALNTLNIASDCPSGPREILLDGKAGLLFTPGNANELQQCLYDVCYNKIDNEAMKEAAFASLYRFNKVHVMGEVESMIRDNIARYKGINNSL